MKLSNGSGTSARRRGWVHAALLVCTALLFACGDDFSPTAPSPEPGLEVNVLPTVSILTEAQTLDGGATLSLRATSADADGTIESYAWSGTGTFSDPAIQNPAWTAPAATASDQEIVLTLTVTDNAGATASTSVTITVRADFFLTVESGVADYIEALFLGMGPLSPRDNNGCPDGEYGHWIGWEQNIRLRITVSDIVDGAAMRLVETAVMQLSEATAGRYFATYSRTDVPDPIPGLHEVTLTEHPDPVSQGCPLSRGCTIFTFTGHEASREFHSSGTSLLRGARAIIQTTYPAPQGHLHDAIGHGALGLCHIDETRNGGTHNSLMSGGPMMRGSDLPDRLTQRDLDAIKAVFSSDLAVGARRADFVREGLVNP